MFRFSEGREERRKKKEKKKKGSRPASGGRWRQAPDGCDRRRTRVDHRLEQRSSSEASTRVACKPGRTATRAEPTGPADPRLRGGGRAWQARVQPATGAFPRAWPHTPSVLLARERAWNGQFGPVVFWFPDFCPGSSSNTIFT